MKLNPDCTRDILICLEEVTKPHCVISYSSAQFQSEFKRLEKYSVEELEYHVQQCKLSGFFLDFRTDLSGEWMIRDITPTAHNFLANIREDTIWNGVKSVAAKVGAKSTDALIQIASNVVTELIRAQFGLSPTL